MRRTVLGVKIDDVSQEEALGIVEGWLTVPRHSGARRAIESSKKDAIASLQHDQKLIFTPGPEFLVTASRDKDFQKILNAGDLNLPDGFGLQLFGGVKNRIPGVDFMLALCGLAQKNNWTVGMIGNPHTKLAAEKLKEKFPQLKITFAFDNPEADKVLNDYDMLRYVDILFVGVGHPEQECVLAKFKMQNARFDREARRAKFKIGMGVGGSFDFISGKIKRAPVWLQKLGLEWWWRLILEPKRLKRIVNATIIFPWNLIKD